MALTFQSTQGFNDKETSKKILELTLGLNPNCVTLMSNEINNLAVNNLILQQIMIYINLLNNFARKQQLTFYVNQLKQYYVICNFDTAGIPELRQSIINNIRSNAGCSYNPTACS